MLSLSIGLEESKRERREVHVDPATILRIVRPKTG